MKVLIFKKDTDLAPTGGPNGYLYNLKKGLDANKINNIEFLKGDIKPKKKFERLKNKLKEFSFVKNCLKKKDNNNLIKYLTSTFDNIINNKVFGIKVDNINSYDMIHFHTTIDLFNMKNELEKYKGKILLTSHSPMPLHQEFLDGLKNTGYKDVDKYKGISIIDEYAFNKADYIIFPCKEAEEPYYNQWDKYKNIHNKNKNKYRYLLSGLDKVRVKVKKNEIRDEYNIPKDAFLISYVGRHNEVKGYNLLKEIGKEVLSDENIYIICAGKEGPLFHLENNHWIEVGWTNDPYSIVGASDLFILPNKETYFDLVFLEVLSTATPMLVSYTGGNKYFKNFKDTGIFFFKNKKEAISQINEIKKIKNLKKIGLKNKKLFEKNFDSKIFAQKYIELLNEIYKD